MCSTFAPKAATGAALMLLLGISWAPTVLAQGPDPQDPAGPQEVPVVVPADDILIRADQEEQNLRRLDAVMAPHPSIMEIDAARDALAPVALALRSDLDALGTEPASRRRLNDQRYLWGEIQTMLQIWRSTVDARSLAFATERNAIIDTQDLWERTLAASRSDVDELPDSILRIESLLAELDGARTELGQQRDDLAVVVDRVVTEQRIAEEALARPTAYWHRGRDEIDDAPGACPSHR